MKILVIGSGGREHALAWKLSQSPKAQQVFVAPGNGGTALAGRKIQNIEITDLLELRSWALEQQIDLTVVGPENALALGVVDDFRNHNLKIIGPTQKAAQLESSKSFAKNFMKRHNIPTAIYEIFNFQQKQEGHKFIDKLGVPIVIKADGLAAGKGVVVATERNQAHKTLDFMLNKEGTKVVIEEFLEGEEASFIVLSDGENIVPLATSQDHKRLNDNDLGPNTGGMGAYSPAPIVTSEIHEKVLNEIVKPTILGMKKEGILFTGFLYAGLMIDKKNQKIKTLEFNTRMGDPETQPILMRLKSDLLEILLLAVDNKLNGINLDWDNQVSLGLVLASAGYPDNPQKGDLITNLPDKDNPDLIIFHAGTKLNQDNQLITNSGRVLCVTTLAKTIKEAQEKVYKHNIHYEGIHYRKDIGNKSII